MNFYYPNGEIWENTYARYDEQMTCYPYLGDQCFLITHHFQDIDVIREQVKNISKNGYHYVNIFGQHALLWKTELQAVLPQSVKIEASTIALDELSYNLAMFSVLYPETKNIVIGDDSEFLAAVLEDAYRVINGHTLFSAHDWYRFKSGFEFNYNNKDAIISIYDRVMLGFIGQEQEFDSISQAFYSHVFDDKTFNQVWREMTNKE